MINRIRARSARIVAPSSLDGQVVIALDGSLSRDELYAIVDGARVQLAISASERMETCHAIFMRWLEAEHHIYGSSSGVGDLRDIDVPEESRGALQLNI